MLRLRQRRRSSPQGVVDYAYPSLYESGNTAAFLLNEEELEQRLQSRYGNNSRQILDVYHRSRPGASPSQLYIAITGSATALGEITIAERQCAARRSEPLYVLRPPVQLHRPWNQLPHRRRPLPRDPLQV